MSSARGRCRSGVVAGLIAATALAGCDTGRVPESPERAAARAHHRKSSDQIMRLQWADAERSLREALRADPTYLPAIFDFKGHQTQYGSRQWGFVDSMVTRIADAGLQFCVAEIVAGWRGVRATIPPAPPVTEDARLCTFFRDHFGIREMPLARGSADSLEIFIRRFPDSPSALSLVQSIAPDVVGWVAVERTAREAVARADSPILRQIGYTWLVRALHELGRDSAAVAAERAVHDDPAWSLPGFRLTLLRESAAAHSALDAIALRPDPIPLARHSDSVGAAAAEAVSIALRHGDLVARSHVLLGRGIEYLDRGRLGEAIDLLTPAATLMDSTGDRGWMGYARMRLGRAQVKAGRSREAERTLLLARALSDTGGLPTVQKEVEHNLLHLYEALGRDADAERAAERFVHFAGMAYPDPVRMMSRRDFGMFLRARGRIAESRAQFDQMMHVVDSVPTTAYFGGEYRELTGDFDGALAHYSRTVNGRHDEMRALAGLVRVALAMGDTAAARRFAVTHDARRDLAGLPESAPVLPSVLRKTAGPAAARPAFESARTEVKRHDQVAAWAGLTVDLAAVDIELGAFERAALLADTAAAAARSVGAADIALRSRATAAAARARIGNRTASAARDSLRALVRQADRSASIEMRATIHRLAAGAADAAGSWRDALGEYARAASPLDSVAALIAMDPTQAAYRSAQRQVYDEALSTILRHAKEPGALEAWAEWSTRRKGRAYAVALPARFTGEVALAAPASGTAIVDFALLDSSVAALVIGPGSRALIRLAVAPSELRAAISALHRSVDARVGSAIDLSRARFPLAGAHELYRMLLEPLEPALRGARHLLLVPDGAIGVVPFDALVTRLPQGSQSEREAEFLIDRFTISNGTTVRVSATPAHVSAQRITVIATDDVPASAAEATAIGAAVPRGEVVVLRGAGATVSSAIDAARTGGIVHFATHAEANERDPAASFIALASNGRGNGRLGAAEVSASTITADLVVLSACETAAGRILDGEGVLSLSRGFLKAGARATIATLWPVGASAADFAREFYSSLAKSGDAPDALRAAKLAMRRDGAPAFAWAPYQLYSGSPARPSARPIALHR
jgi:CHAT domain-containing protein/tetratricopeptide (TPR) repeat protein